MGKTKPAQNGRPVRLLNSEQYYYRNYLKFLMFFACHDRKGSCVSKYGADGII